MTPPARTATRTAGRTTRTTPGRTARTATSTRDYTALAASRVRKPSQIPEEEKFPSIFVYARNKRGKSYFGMQGEHGIERTLVLDPEGGTDEFVDQDPNVYPITKWEDMHDAYMYLRHGKHNYTSVCIDGLTRINNFALRWIMGQMEEADLSRKPGMVDQRDYGKSGIVMQQMLYNFHTLRMTKIYTAQERAEGGNDFSEDADSTEAKIRHVPDLPKGVRAAINAQVDVIGRMYIVRVQKKGETDLTPQRRLWVEPHEAFDTGYRSDYVMPAYIRNPTPARVIRTIREGAK